MQQLNCYNLRSRISEHKFRQIILYFALDLTPNQTANLTALTHKTVNQIYLKIRHSLAQDSERQSPFSGEAEVDEYYFRAKRVSGKHGRGVAGKTIVFGIFFLLLHNQAKTILIKCLNFFILQKDNVVVEFSCKKSKSLKIENDSIAELVLDFLC